MANTVKDVTTTTFDDRTLRNSVGAIRQVETANEDYLDSLQENHSSLHRISSESTIQQITVEEDEAYKQQHDPYRSLERSQSDASLLQNFNFPKVEIPVHLGENTIDYENTKSMCNVSECTRVYMDLSRAEPFEPVQFADSTVSMLRTSSGRQLETIPQDEELRTEDLNHCYSLRMLCSNDVSLSGSEDLASYARMMSGEPSSQFSHHSQKTKASKFSNETFRNSSCRGKAHLQSNVHTFTKSLNQKVHVLQMGSLPEQIAALDSLSELLQQATESVPVFGKDIAYTLCDILGEQRTLDCMISNLASSNYQLVKASAYLLKLTLTTSILEEVVDCGLEAIVKMTVDYQGDVGLSATITGILESLFKTSEETCSRVIKLGGLDVVIYWCRCSDHTTLKHCAIALSNLALYGGPDNQLEMAIHKVPEWLFPLAFMEDDSIRYYACLAVAILVSNEVIEASVVNSGTLALVSPFVSTHDPQVFASCDAFHRHGRSVEWLCRLVPLLRSKRPEARALAAFHLVMEAGIKVDGDQKEVLYEAGVVKALVHLASGPDSAASRLAADAIGTLQLPVPHKLSQYVPLWTNEDVTHWVAQVGFEEYCDAFSRCNVDGDLLLRLTDSELNASIGIGCAVTRKRFFRELMHLKISANYSSCDPSKLDDWLKSVGPELSQYTFQMVQAGVSTGNLHILTISHLTADCHINNRIHCEKILTAVKGLALPDVSHGHGEGDRSVKDATNGARVKKRIDVFISYRRCSGSHLASLLKVHLQLRGFSVFIDIERLRSGKFDDGLLGNVRRAANFIIILTPNSLDHCVADDETKDLVHKEIVAAIQSRLNIVPILDDFHYPPAGTLPKDMRSICSLSGVRWIHDYQDVCIDKVERFLRCRQAATDVASQDSSAGTFSGNVP